MKTKTKGMIVNSHWLEVAYQEEEMCYVNQIVNNAQVDTLHNVTTSFKETEIYVNNEKEANEENMEEDEDDKNERVIGMMRRRTMMKRMMITLNRMIRHSYRYPFEYERLLNELL